MKNKIILAISTMLTVPAVKCFGHTVNYDFASMTNSEVGLVYLKMGFAHILPRGLDHVLFILGLFFLNTRLTVIIWQATAFTIAHCITLGLAIYGVIHPINSIIEPIIALSILFIAIENILYQELKWWRVLVVFVFGLIHGCGFASALTEVGLPEKNYVLALSTFNIGVEFGQVAVILFAWLVVGKWFAGKTWYRKRIVIPMSVCIGCVALFWTIERTFFNM
jgi:hypothetical protein